MLAQIVSSTAAEAIPAIGLMASVLIMMRWLKLLSDKDWNGVITQVVAWAVGMVFVLVWAQSAWAAFITFQGITLDKMNTASLVIAGFAAGSSASLAYVALKAFDNTQSAAEPPLIK